MKKIIALLLALTMVFAFAACAAKTETPATTETTTTETTTTEETKTEETPAAETTDEVKTYKVGVAIYQFDDNFMTLYRNELKSYMESLQTDTVKYDITIVDGKNDMGDPDRADQQLHHPGCGPDYLQPRSDLLCRHHRQQGC